MSRGKLATAARFASSATAAGFLLYALAAGNRSRPEAVRIRGDEAQMATLAKAHEDGGRQIKDGGGHLYA